MDSAGNRTAKTDELANVTSNYSYDALYELTKVTQGSATTESYSYDSVGNRTASLNVPSYTVNSSNELTADSNASFTYDSNGNTLTKIDSTGTTGYSWDYENRLTSVTLPGSAGTVTFKYDPFGRRIEKISPTMTSIFAYDGDHLIEEANGSGAKVASYTQTQNIDEPLAMKRSGTIDFYEQDGLGSVTSLTSSSGSVAQTYTYGSFGNQTASSGSLTNSFRYTVREFDTETGLYYYRARYYEPTTGRFLSEDPNKDGVAASLYDYVRNNPTGETDSFGMAGLVIGPNTPSNAPSEFNAGFDEALNRLKDSKCRKIFCKTGKDLGYDYLANILKNTSYYIEPLPRGAGAATESTDEVFIGNSGPFFTGDTNISIPPAQMGLSSWPSVNFQSPAQMRAFILLHELGHQTGVFGPDQFDFINGQHSIKVLENCFGDASVN